MIERTGSVVHWTRLNDSEYDKQLRLKLAVEVEEIHLASTKEELCHELTDALEVIECLCSANGLSMEEVLATKNKKQNERGSFMERGFVTIAEHLEGSFGESYCLADPNNTLKSLLNRTLSARPFSLERFDSESGRYPLKSF